MMWIKNVFLFLLSFCAGATVSGGIFAFVLVIGIVPRILRKYHISKYVNGVETLLCLGMISGTVLSVLQISLRWSKDIGQIIFTLFSICAGIYVGCVSMALAEALDVYPIIFRRCKLTKGMGVLIFTVALGKMLGAFFYFLWGFPMVE